MANIQTLGVAVGDAVDDLGEIIARVDAHSGAGVITLNRPRALNALNPPHFEALHRVLAAWVDNNDVSFVVFHGAGDKAFCAGGDVKWLRSQIMNPSGPRGPPSSFTQKEYATDHYIHRYPKPVISFVDGIFMGGGAGVALAGNLRLAGDKTRFSMPECLIGLFPDVGTSYWLTHLPATRGIGYYLALTGRSVTAPWDVMNRARVATHYIPSGKHAEVFTALTSGAPGRFNSLEQITALVESFTTQPPATTADLSDMEAAGDDLEAVFGDVAPVEVVLERLQALASKGSSWARGLLDKELNVAVAAPISLKATREAARRGALMGVEEAYKMEHRVGVRMMDPAGDPKYCSHFVEGVRAKLIDRDNKPQWALPTLASVDDEVIASFFEPLDDTLELKFFWS